MNSTTWFWSEVIGASLCGVLALVVLGAGARRKIAEVGLLGSSLLVISLLSVAHGLSGTGVGRGAPASGWAGALALPLALCAAIPTMVPRSRFAAAVVQRWKHWAATSAAGALVLSCVLVSNDSGPSPLVGKALMVCAIGGASALVSRQYLLYRISNHRAPLIALSALVGLTCLWLVAMGLQPTGGAAWAILIAENAAVLVAGVAIVHGYRTGRDVSDALKPILSSEPLAALELGLSPEIHAFVGALATKDHITRDHVVRTSALALRVSMRAGLGPRQARDVAVGALLHDIGKLVVPSEILNKPSDLSDEEYERIKTHPEQGERLLAGSPSLAGAMRFVRSHHERVDGRGYPDGLAGDDVSVEVGIVSAVDAWDAMTNTRQYREGMGTDRAVAILREGAGTQWRSDVVELLLAEVSAEIATGLKADASSLKIGRTSADQSPSANATSDDWSAVIGLADLCICEDALQ